MGKWSTPRRKLFACLYSYSIMFMEIMINDALQEYETDTYDMIRTSYANLMKEINDALDNVLTVTSMDLERCVKQSLIKLKKTLAPEPEPIRQDYKVSNRASRKRDEPEYHTRATREREVTDWYEEILYDDDQILQSEQLVLQSQPIHQIDITEPNNSVKHKTENRSQDV